MKIEKCGDGICPAAHGRVAGGGHIRVSNAVGADRDEE